MPAVANTHIKAFNFFWQPGVQPKNTSSDFQSSVATLNHIHRTRHGAQVNALGRCSSLYVFKIALQRFFKNLIRFFSVGS